MVFVKNAIARDVAIDEASTIARDLGLRRTKTLTLDDLWELTDRADTTRSTALTCTASEGPT